MGDERMNDKKGNHGVLIRELRKKIQAIFAAPQKQKTEKNFTLRSFTLRNTVQQQKELKMAAIMDRFTLDCFRPECCLLELTPENWRKEMENFAPDVLFIESAWEGKDGLWRGKIDKCSLEVFELTEYCHQNSIPVVFWNKEDPVYTDKFLTVARRADFVFTTDIDCIQKYKTELGHDRVYHLHFAAQPIVHNPIEKYDRKNRFCFAGAYYHRYQDRCKVFDAFAEYFIASRGLDIYDRNYLNAKPEHKFPEWYDPFILGRLDPSEIDIAYKGYMFGVNMNSVSQSQTMFARRVFELIASNTIVVGNYSRGVKNYFGDLTYCTDDEKTLRTGIERYCADVDSADKLRLLALRKVLSEHLMEDRLDYIVKKVFSFSLKPALPTVLICARVKDQEEADRILRMYRLQSYQSKSLLLVTDAAVEVPQEVAVLCEKDIDNNIASLLDNTDYVAMFSAADWYGENYLLDLVLTTRYGAFTGVGKAEYFSAENGCPERVCSNLAYHRVGELTFRRSMIKTQLVREVGAASLQESFVWQGDAFMSADVMNYCETWAKNDCSKAEDLEIAEQGVPVESMEQAARDVKPIKDSGKVMRIPVSALNDIKVGADVPVELSNQGTEVALSSAFQEGVFQYLFLGRKWNIDPYVEDGKVEVLFRGEAWMDVTGCCVFCDKDNNKISRKNVKIGIRSKIDVPAQTAYIQIAYRVCGPGRATLRDVEFGSGGQSSLLGGCFLSRSNVLIVTNNYPASNDLYRNMFVHKRLMSYKARGCVADVLRVNAFVKAGMREFEGINVLEGQGDLLEAVLRTGAIDTVCVHFLDESIWEVLRRYQADLRIFVWPHGADIQPWWRRPYLYKTEQELDVGKQKSQKRMELWRDVFEAAEKNDNIHFVFVSEHFAKEIFEDYTLSLREEQYSIIHNCIDTEQFSYTPKQPEDRKRLLSIRPFASEVYANDLTVKMIRELAKKPWFNELEIAIYGRGPLFSETLDSVREYTNVHIEETFLTQSEIAEIHKNYGVFLVPSRMDTQGVSRDEAMSSGLVPVTTAVAAIPEFVDENCGILAPAEDYVRMADGVCRLYENPEEFLRLSENAAQRVRRQTSAEYTIAKELALIWKEQNGSAV